MKFERRAIWPVLAMALTLALPACQAEKQPASQRAAGGEVLPGSASDAMLPVDTLRSQPPLAPRPSGSAKVPGGKAAPSQSAAAEAESGNPAPAEAAEPAAAQ